MTPDQINAKHGKPSWRCNSCRAENGLMWWQGLSVAVCRDNPECSRAEQERFAVSIAALEAEAAREAEYFGGAA